MLRRLLVRNFAIVPEVTLEFSPGLNVLTGETGAGKSILMDAIGLLAGRRASEEDVRQGEEMAVVEGSVETSKTSPIWAFLRDSGVPISGDEIVIRRVVGMDGRSRAFVNDWQWTVSGLAQLATYWIDISGQHGQQRLLDESTHVELLDADLPPEVRENYRTGFASVRTLDREICELKERREKALKEREYLDFQIRELNQAALKSGEEEELKSKHARLAHAEKLARACTTVESLLSGEEGIEAKSGLLEGEIAGMQRFDSSLSTWLEDISTIRAHVGDLAERASKYARSLEFEPEALEQMNERLSMIQKISRKYGSVEGAIAERDRIADLLSSLENVEADEKELLVRRETAARELIGSAKRLTKGRKERASKLSDAITKELRKLGMPSASVEFGLVPVETGEATVKVDDRTFGISGAETAVFMLAPNPGEGAKSLAKIASGGELSRVLLAIKGISLGNRDSADVTFLFDEVDAGIGGETAERVGMRMHHLSGGKQVLCVTHLAQIACYADAHLQIKKEVQRGRTVAKVLKLKQPDRAEELARMIGGVQITPKTRDYADELLKKGTLRKHVASTLAT